MIENFVIRHIVIFHYVRIAKMAGRQQVAESVVGFPSFSCNFGQTTKIALQESNMYLIFLILGFRYKGQTTLDGSVTKALQPQMQYLAVTSKSA